LRRPKREPKRWHSSKRDRVDCVVLDLKLPTCPDSMVLETIRDDAELRDIPVVGVHGSELSADEDATLHHHGAQRGGQGRPNPRERLLR